MKVIKIENNYPGFSIEVNNEIYLSAYFSYLTTYLKFTENGKDIVITLDRDDLILLRGKDIKTKSSYYMKKEPYILNKVYG